MPALTLRGLSLLRQRPGSHQFGSGRHLGESAGGTWTLTISNLRGFGGGVLESWRIKAYGHGFTPGFPPIPTATSGMRTLTIDWDAPTDIGDSAVTSYDLRYIPSNATGKTDPANWMEVTGIGTDDTGTYEITGLGPGRPVRRAGAGRQRHGSRSLVGEPRGEEFARAAVRPVADQRDAPRRGPGGNVGRAHRGRRLRDHQLRPAHDPQQLHGRADLPGVDPDDGDLQGRVASLTNGVEYDVQVRARNAIGEGEWSEETLKGMPAIQNTDASFADDTATIEVAEDIAVDSNVGARVAATDPDRDDTLTYSIGGGQ